MEEEREYLIPDYFSDFKCKMGACRAACCEGWAVSVSMTDYFKLLGLETSAFKAFNTAAWLQPMFQPKGN